MSVLDNFEQWKDFLADRLHHGKDEGMDAQSINQIAYQVGDYLAEQVEPRNEEERLLKELWDKGNDQERQVIANLMIKLVQGDGTH